MFKASGAPRCLWSRDLETCRSCGVRKRARSGETSHSFEIRSKKPPHLIMGTARGLFAIDPEGRLSSLPVHPWSRSRDDWSGGLKISS